MCKKVIASEFVSWGHPDKIADQISDALVDEFVKNDKNSRTGIEVMVKDNIVVLGGEVHSSAKVDYDSVVRRVFSTLNFSKEHHLSPSEIKIINLIGKQSPEIHQGVDQSEEIIGAGDQGFVCGFASDDTEVFMPLGHHLAKVICQGILKNYRYGDSFGPDAKSQVIVEYDTETNESKVLSILVSIMHEGELEECRRLIGTAIRENEIGIDDKLYEKYIKDKDVKIDINPCGSWHIGGPVADCGVTGRKIVVDQYGGYCSVGGGSYSGKCATKVDRSAAYMARYLAKNIVASGLCHNCKVEISYMIGVPEPSSLNIEMSENCELSEKVKQWILDNISLTPYGIIKRFKLQTCPNFQWSAKFGHYGYNNEADILIRPWEKLDFYKKLQKEFEV